MNDLMIKRAIWDKQIVIRKDDTISRQLAIEAIKRAIWDKQTAKDAIDVVCNIPSVQSDTCDGCMWEDTFGYGECYRCKRAFNDMYEVKDDERSDKS